MLPGRALLRRAGSSPVPIATAAAARRRSVRFTTRYLVVGWRRERPESIPVAGRCRLARTALRLHTSGTHARRTHRSRAHVVPLRVHRTRRTRTAARRAERTVSAPASILNTSALNASVLKRRRIARTPVPRIIHLPVRERACTRPLRIAVRGRTAERTAESGGPTSTPSAASRNCAHMALLHRLSQT